MPNLPQPLCSGEAGGSSKQRAAARLEEKTTQPLPQHTSPTLELGQGRVSPGKEHWRKSQGRLAAFALQRLPFPPTSAPTAAPARRAPGFPALCTGLVLHSRDALAPGKGQESSCTLCLLTHRIYRVSNRNLNTSSRSLSTMAKCTETPRAKWGNAPKAPPVPLAPD